MTFNLDQSVSVLQRTPAAVQALLGSLSDEWARSNYGENTFSPFDVVGHLIHADRANWMVRLRTILEHGDARPFPPFDRYAMYETSKGKSMAELLETFAAVRGQNLADLRSVNLSPADLDRRGRHPDLGAVTVRQLLSSWTVHDLGHLHQIAKCMAYQYRDEVGPWKQYLTILPEAP